MDSAVYAALGRDFAKSLLPLEGRGDNITVTGAITKPLQCRGSRTMQVFFVNGRFIKSQLLTAAVEEGYRNQIMKGKFPGCVLSVTIPETEVDVNVHPAKTQVKFAREKAVFDTVYHTVLDRLDRQETPKPVPTARTPEFFQTMDAETFRKQMAGKEKPSSPAPSVQSPRPTAEKREQPEHVEKKPLRPLTPSALSAPPPSVTASAESKPEGPLSLREHGFRYQVPKAGEPSAPRTAGAQTDRSFRYDFSPCAPKPAQPKEPEPSAEPAPAAIPQDRAAIPAEPVQTELPAPEIPWRIVGEVLHTYVICESGEGKVYLIDKHAAHERINFDRLMDDKTPPMSQTLLTPIAATPGRENAELLLEHLDLLKQLGFLCEDFGDGTILVRELPADLDPGDVPATLEAMAEDLRTGRSLDERRMNLLHTMACKAAIKGGWTTDPAELRVLVDKVQSGEIQYCPHGRPVAVELTKYALEKMFQRA